MTDSASVEISHAFVLTSVEAAKLWSILGGSFESVVASARCSDGIRREFQSQDQLTNYENPRTRAIRALILEARSRQPYGSASITLGGRYSSSIEVSISGDEITVLRLRDRIAEILDGMRPWYSPISRVDFFYIVGGALLLAFLVLQGVTSGSSSQKTLTFAQAAGAAVIVIAFLILVGSLIWALNRLRDRFFPITVFAIGQGQVRFEFDDKIRWVVIVGFGVSVFASILVTLLLAPIAP